MLEEIGEEVSGQTMQGLMGHGKAEWSAPKSSC